VCSLAQGAWDAPHSIRMAPPARSEFDYTIVETSLGTTVPRSQPTSAKIPAKPEQTLAQFQAVLAAALDPIITIDAHGVIQSASDSIERVFGWKPQEVVGKNVTILMPEPHHSRHDGYLAEYRRTHRTNILGRTREFFAVRKDGCEFPIELSVSRVDIPNLSEPWFMGIIHDATDRKRTETELEQHRAHLEEMVRQRTAQLESSNEQLRQADRLASIGTLAAGLGHDMNNVLLPIRARLDALDAAELPVSAREQFQAVRRSVNYLQQLSDGLHLMALDPQDAEASGGETDVQEWWRQIGALLSKAIPRRIAFNVEIEPSLPAIALPPHRLTQSILNLLVNAGEAISGEGSVRLWARSANGAKSVRIGVTDTGEGMTPEVRNHAFDPFFTTKKRGLGTGLGLSLVRGVAQSAGGTVEIESAPGQGTTVVLGLPVVKERARAGSPSADAVVVVSIRDRRGASMVSTLLASQPLIIKTSRAAINEHSRLWIVDPGLTTRSEVNEYLRGDRRRRVVLFGKPEDEWTARRVLLIDDATNMDTIRRTLGEALSAIGGSQ
jgi:PAS domain S-box-containing protein